MKGTTFLIAASVAMAHAQSAVLSNDTTSLTLTPSTTFSTIFTHPVRTSTDCEESSSTSIYTSPVRPTHTTRGYLTTVTYTPSTKTEDCSTYSTVYTHPAQPPYNGTATSGGIPSGTDVHHPSGPATSVYWPNPSGSPPGMPSNGTATTGSGGSGSGDHTRRPVGPTTTSGTEIVPIAGAAVNRVGGVLAAVAAAAAFLA